MAVPAPSGDTTRATSTDRIAVLDILRGVALLGMFLVHFNDQSIAVGTQAGVSSIYQRTVTLFFEERFWTMFGILFGAGFAVQLRRAEVRGGPFVRIYLRRLGTLAAVGLLAHAVFGYHVLFEYAVWGVPLLFVRRWPVRVLIVAAIVSAASGSIFSIARASYGVGRVGAEVYRTELARERTANQEFTTANRTAQQARDYKTVLAARWHHIVWFYSQPFFFLPVNTFTLFLIGVIGLRLGLFEKPEAHQLLIATVIVCGVVSWAAAHWLLPLSWQAADPPVGDLAIRHLTSGFGLIREMWLAFAYIGGVLLLVAHNPSWCRRLAAFGWTGRMALTNYIVQIAILDLLFSNYALGATLTPLASLGAGLALFAVDAAVSRWWLKRFRFGPAEWVWRSITFGRMQPWRVDRREAAATMA